MPPWRDRNPRLTIAQSLRDSIKHPACQATHSQPGLNSQKPFRPTCFHIVSILLSCQMFFSVHPGCLDKGGKDSPRGLIVHPGALGMPLDT